MGTRSLTAVVLNGKYKVAQYAQYDGYPSGQGAEALEFVQAISNTDIRPDIREKFVAALEKVCFLSDDEIVKEQAQLGIKGQWLTEEMARVFHRRFPFFSREHGAKILQMIFESDAEKIELQNSIDFALDSLFCEWAYVIDLDKNTFEVYKGFQRDTIPETDRFFESGYCKTSNSDTKYYPVRMVVSWSFEDLPSEKDFIRKFRDQDEDEDN